MYCQVWLALVSHQSPHERRRVFPSPSFSTFGPDLWRLPPAPSRLTVAARSALRVCEPAKGRSRTSRFPRSGSLKDEESRILTCSWLGDETGRSKCIGVGDDGNLERVLVEAVWCWGVYKVTTTEMGVYDNVYDKKHCHKANNRCLIYNTNWKKLNAPFAFCKYKYNSLFSCLMFFCSTVLCAYFISTGTYICWYLEHWFIFWGWGGERIK